ncbi:hypothetical protein [Methylobacter sp. YRD-M1]|uniref:hypothetical protein n=1 Tax=Methylobacter sp. YRD-M1 TaxID=2911520 RepID=UPI00227A2818|nr:hypothetical protein [Methylobacter sp. YRD-M1]WAK00561.1 hypothetical protein LZ558_11940 [Methylobacter sp. YRD-M1]
MIKSYNIQIPQHFNSPSEMELFSILQQLLPIRFILGIQDGIEANGIIAGDTEAQKDVAGITSLRLPLSAKRTDRHKQIETEVKFADDPDVPFPFRGRTVNTKLTQIRPVLSTRTDEKILAASKQGPIWIVSKVNGIKHFKSVLPLPSISTEQNFSDVFNGECFLELLVLLEFIREISTGTAYQHPPLRASFIVDDPNLHWPSYGYIDYRKIAARAKKENYHVSFATIPLDTWFTHGATADLFRTNSRWLSLLIHGNNHSREELARNYSEMVRNGLLRQAIRRINRMEQKANLRVCRVMVPPHGACSSEMLAELPKCGFESACISAGSLRAHNQDEPWIKKLGFFPSEMIEGCPVLPRWGLNGNVKNSLLVAAYLGQPMILRGHHQDLKDGGEIFDEFAKFINGFGNVFWSSMTDLSRLNYLWRIEKTACHIKPLGMNITFKLPNGAASVVIENPGAMVDCTWQIVSADGNVHKIMPGEHLRLAEKMGSEISIERNALSQLQHASVAANHNSTDTVLILRRLLTEARDRLLIS